MQMQKDPSTAADRSSGSSRENGHAAETEEHSETAGPREMLAGSDRRHEHQQTSQGQASVEEQAEKRGDDEIGNNLDHVRDQQPECLGGRVRAVLWAGVGW